MAVMNPPEKKLEKRTSVHWLFFQTCFLDIQISKKKYSKKNYPELRIVFLEYFFLNLEI